MRAKRLHETHTDVAKRLKRACGHLSTVITMIEEGRSCLELAQQMQAVENAIANAKKTLIHDHVDRCLDAAVRRSGASSRKSLDEFRDITKYL